MFTDQGYQLIWDAVTLKTFALGKRELILPVYPIFPEINYLGESLAVGAVIH